MFIFRGLIKAVVVGLALAAAGALWTRWRGTKPPWVPAR